MRWWLVFCAAAFVACSGGAGTPAQSYTPGDAGFAQPTWHIDPADPAVRFFLKREDCSVAALNQVVGIRAATAASMVSAGGFDQGSATMTRVIIAAVTSVPPISVQTIARHADVTRGWTLGYSGITPGLGTFGFSMSNGFFTVTGPAGGINVTADDLPFLLSWTITLATPGNLNVRFNGVDNIPIASNLVLAPLESLRIGGEGVALGAVDFHVLEYMSSDSTIIPDRAAVEAANLAALAEGGLLPTFTGAQHYWSARDCRCLNFPWVDRITGVDALAQSGSHTTTLIRPPAF